MGKHQNKARDGFSKCDYFFGHRINLNFAGKNEYRTNCGALVSLLLIVCLSVFVLAEIARISLSYFGVHKNFFLQSTPISTVTTIDEKLLNEGYDLKDGEGLFEIAIGIKSNDGGDDSEESSGSLAMMDPKIGWFVAELEEYKTDSYHGTLQRNTRQLAFKACPSERPKHLSAQTCVDFQAKDDDGNINAGVELSMFGTYDGYGRDFSYIKVYFQKCTTTALRKILDNNSSRCSSSSQFDRYVRTMKVELAVHDAYIDLTAPTLDFYKMSSKRRIISQQKLSRSSQSVNLHNLQLVSVLHSAAAPLDLQTESKTLSLTSSTAKSDVSTTENTARLFAEASELSDSPANIDDRDSTVLQIDYFLLTEQVRIVQQENRPFVLFVFLTKLGGLAFGLYLLGKLLTTMAFAKTLFLVKFTEAMYTQQTNAVTNFDKQAESGGGESTVRPLRVRGGNYSTPKMQLLAKVEQLCGGQAPGGAAVITKEDSDVMWNEFLRFRSRIRYNLMCIVLCCCTRKQRTKADSELYKQLLLKSSEEHLQQALDVRSIVRTNKYLKLLLQSALSKEAQFMIRNQHGSLLRIQTQAFADDSAESFSLSEPDNDLGDNLDYLIDFTPTNRTEATLLRGFLQKPKKESALEPPDSEVEQSQGESTDRQKKHGKSGKRKNKSQGQVVPRRQSLKIQQLGLIRESKSGSLDRIDPQEMMAEQHGFIQVNDAMRGAAAVISSQSAGAAEQDLDYIDDDQQFYRTIDKKNKKKSGKSKHKRSGSLTIRNFDVNGRETETKEREHVTDWEDPYHNAIGQKLTQLRVQGSPMYEVGSHSESVVELNKLSNLLQKW